MSKAYDPKDWYWVVGGDMTKAYSSKVGDYVPGNNPAFVAWRADGSRPTPIDTEEHLGQVLAQHLMRPTSAVPVILDAYKEALGQTMTPIDVLPQVIFMMENQIRTLQGNPPLTFEQFRTFVKGLM